MRVRRSFFAAILIALLLLPAMGVTQAHAAITDGLEAYWTFDAINAGFR